LNDRINATFEPRRSAETERKSDSGPTTTLDARLCISERRFRTERSIGVSGRPSPCPMHKYDIFLYFCTIYFEIYRETPPKRRMRGSVVHLRVVELSSVCSIFTLSPVFHNTKTTEKHFSVLVLFYTTRNLKSCFQGCPPLSCCSRSEAEGDPGSHARAWSV